MSTACDQYVALFQEYFNGEATSSEEVVFWMFLHHNSKEGVYYKKVFISPIRCILYVYLVIWLLFSCHVYLSSYNGKTLLLERYHKPSQISIPLAFFDWWSESSLAVSTFRFAESFSLPTVAGDLDFILAFPFVGPGVCCGCCI